MESDYNRARSTEEQSHALRLRPAMFFMHFRISDGHVASTGIVQSRTVALLMQGVPWTTSSCISAIPGRGHESRAQFTLLLPDAATASVHAFGLHETPRSVAESSRVSPALRPSGSLPHASTSPESDRRGMSDSASWRLRRAVLGLLQTKGKHL